MQIIEKYLPSILEKQYNKKWLDSSLYTPRGLGKPFAIVCPPPNVTGILHIGHALNFTLQDIYSRYKFMQGFKVLWIPGVDHAGIATQMMVEKALIKEGTTRQELGRKEFLKRVWVWKESYSERIIEQLHSLNISCTWDRIRFTLDDGLSKAVNKTFIDLHDSGLIYRDKRLVNWDTSLKTAVSDLEVIHEDRDEILYDLKYFLVSPTKKNRYLTVSTVRPETLFGDEAIAVNPKDKKNNHLIGQTCIIPLINKEIPIISDTMVKKDFGTGLVKITPAHDFNDFKVAKRHKLPITEIMDLDGKLNENVSKPWQGLDRLKARKPIVEELKKLDLIEKEEKYRHSVPIGDRSGTEIEPTITWQWFVDAEKLAKPVLDLLKDDCTAFHPHKWKKDFVTWLEKIEPWCISRQLWWGHRIPAWHSEEGIVVAETKEKAKQKFGKDIDFQQDPDVLDTWFSSALWPYSVLGWPEKESKDDVEAFYPAALLVTGNDILFFWVARMMMLGVYTHGKESFKDVFINTIVKDSKGRKMSKTKGNTIDPKVSIEKYGADSLRFALTVQASPNKDIRMDDAKIEGMSFFSTKIWNAIKFLLINLDKHKQLYRKINDIKEWNTAESNWILSIWKKTLYEITSDLNNYRPDLASQKLYKFIRSVFCDWYIEMIKIDFVGKTTEATIEHLNCSYKIITEYMLVLHPFMPVISEELLNKVEKAFSFCSDADYKEKFLLSQKWPVSENSISYNEDQIDDIELFKKVVSEVRSLKSLFDQTSNNMTFSIKKSPNKAWEDYFYNRMSSLLNLKADKNIIFKDGVLLEIKVSTVVCNINVENKNSIDSILIKLKTEEERLNKICQKKQSELQNERFISNAPKPIIEEKKQSIIVLNQEKANISQQLLLLTKSIL